MKISGKAESERTSPLPGLALDCEPAPIKFKSWQKKERRGVLQSMFKWKVKAHQPFVKPEAESKNKNRGQAKNLQKKAAKKEKSCKISFDRKVLKMLTKSKRRGSKTKRKEVSEKVGWRGPRELLSEIPVQRRVFRKKHQVKL